MSSNILVKPRIQLWQMAVTAGVCSYLALGLATRSLHAYNWFMLLAIPAAFLAAERGRRFFLEWAPLMMFWMVYDRLRLLQPLLLPRVSVRAAFEIEQWAFGWLAGGEVPAHAARAWLAGQQGIPLALISWGAQLVYFSHLFVFPVLMLFWWTTGDTGDSRHTRFVRHMRAFTLLHIFAVLIYVLLPVAPPWWVSLNGMAQPTAELLAHTKMSAAMDGLLVQSMIRTASQWFAAVPSLHGAYPALMFLLALKDRSRAALIILGAYCAAMWAATVTLNQHYIIDLLAGAVLALAAWRLAERGWPALLNPARREGRKP